MTSQTSTLSTPGCSVATTRRLGWREIWRHGMPEQESRWTRLVVKSVTALGQPYLIEIRGLEHVAADADPFLFVSNHNQRLEAVLVPALLIYHRAGKIVHFMADWPTLMVPLVGQFLRAGQVIPVTRKSARIRFLNRLKPFFVGHQSATEQALAKLRSGAPVGVFPEATMNRDPRRLLRGQTGAARLALRSGVPVVPAGVRFPDHPMDQPIGDRSRMAIEIGPAIHPPEILPGATPGREVIQAFHADLMRQIARLSGKQWNPKAQRRRYHVS